MEQGSYGRAVRTWWNRVIKVEKDSLRIGGMGGLGETGDKMEQRGQGGTTRGRESWKNRKKK